MQTLKFYPKVIFKKENCAQQDKTTKNSIYITIRRKRAAPEKSKTSAICPFYIVKV